MVSAETSHPWADGPWSLIETPSRTKDVTKHAAIYIANEMAFAHNAMLRGLNSIYLQAHHVSQPRDIADFLFFIHAWTGWVSHHHKMEEESMFPRFEEIMNKPHALEGNVQQHHAFQPALNRLVTYSAETKPTDYQAGIVRELVEELAPSFREHLSDEITSLLAMEPYDTAALLKVYRECEAEAGKQDKHIVPPMVLGLRDITFEGGNNWPVIPMSSLSIPIIRYIFARKHAGSWRFLPCDTWGKPRPLPFASER